MTDITAVKCLHLVLCEYNNPSIMNRHVTLFQTLTSICHMTKRTCSELPKGIKYHGFTFYPRDENFKDPPYEPSKLFYVRRIKSMKGRTATEKQFLAQLNIDGKASRQGDVTVVKNIPQTNALLWKVKHLVDIKPIRINGELPKDGDYTGTYLRKTGEFIVSPKLKVSPKEMEATEEFVRNNLKPTRRYMNDYLRKKWLNAFTPYE